MQIQVPNPILQTVIFAAIFFAAVLLSARKGGKKDIFPLSLTNELKGAAIFMVIFSHVGYFLASDTRFLFPLSIMAGAGVNLFLFLSGYGLSVSALKKKLSPAQFYLKRVLKIFIPLWIVLAALFITDRLFLNIAWPWQDMVKYALGYFPTNDLFSDFNSPLWFLSLIIFYYLIFPFLFSAKRPALTGIGILAAGIVFAMLPLPVSDGVANFYQLHIAAFPLGIIFAALLRRPSPLENSKIAEPLKRIMGFLRFRSAMEKFLLHLKNNPLSWKIATSLALGVLVCYFAVNSFVGRGIFAEQAVSLITVLLFVFLLMLKNIEFKFLSYIGLISYEIYLIHWPIFYRYGGLYNFMPAWLGTVLYFIIIILLASLLMQIAKKINSSVVKLSKKSIDILR